MESTAALEKVSNPPTEIVQPVNSEASSSTQPLSKKARKRLAKAAWIAEQKKGRRAAEKERRREKKRLLAEKRAAGELEEGYEGEQSGSNKKRRVEEFKGPKKPFGARVVVDLGFDNMMSENEIKSLTSQLAFTYSANRRAVHPFSSILFTSLNGRTLTRMDSINNAAYKRWVDTVWWQEGYERLWEGAKEAEVKDVKGGDGIMASAEETEQKEGKSENQSGRAGEVREPHVANRESAVYLTADSTDELTELKEGETYIIGGICDHNRYKNLCLNKSRTTHIRSARLPIGTYLSELRTRKVLTVNQTFEILLKWVETRDWEQALWAVVPKRKFSEGRTRRGGKKVGGDDSEDVAEGENDEADEEVVISATTLEEADDDDSKDDINVETWSSGYRADGTKRQETK